MEPDWQTKTKLKRAPSLSEQVIDFLEGEIERGALKPGDKLPPESTLADQMGVSRIVIREAFSGLRHDGRIETRHGRGAFVAETRKRKAFRLDHLETDRPEDIRHLYELRAVLEGSAAALAAVRATADDIARLKGFLADMDRAVEEGGDGVEPDARFHERLAEASGNPYLSDFMQFIRSRIWDLILHARGHSRKYPGLPRLVQQEHEAIFNAVKSRNADQAREAALRHVQKAAGRLGVEDIIV